jgi:hypothetical protein
MKRGIRQAFGPFLALLALVAQLTLATAAPATTISLADVTTLCRHDRNHGAPRGPAHQMPACQLCLVCHGPASPFGLLTATPALPQPMTMQVARTVILPPAAALPPCFVTAAQPRGPPVLV